MAPPARRLWFLPLLLLAAPLLLAACAQAVEPQQYPGLETSTLPAYEGPASPTASIPDASPTSQPGVTPQPGITPSPTPETPRDTPVLITPTRTPSPTPSITPTPSPTGPTGTPTPTLLYLAGTPLPAPQEITGENVHLLSGLARFEIERLTDLEWSPDGRLLAAANPTAIHLFSPLERELVQELEAGEGLVDIAFSPDSVWLASAGYTSLEGTAVSASVRLWRGPGVPSTPTATPTTFVTALPTRTPSPTSGGPAPTQPGATATLPGPSATASPSPTAGTPQPTIPPPVIFTATPVGTPQAALDAPPSALERLFARLGALAAGLFRPPAAALAGPGAPRLPFQAATQSPAGSPTATLAATQALSATATRAVTQPPTLTPTLTASPTSVLPPFWEPRGVLFLERRPLSQLRFTPGSDRLLTVWSAPEIEPVNVLEFRSTLTWSVTQAITTTTTVLDLVFSPDGGRIATAPNRYALQVWDLARPDEPVLVFFTSFTGAVSSLAFSSDGYTLASGHYDGAIRLWDLEQQVEVGRFQTDGVVESLAFHPDGDLLASGISYPRYQPGRSGSPVQIWSVSGGGLVRTLQGHESGVTRLAFSPDGRLLASGSYDGSVWLWGVP